MTNRLPVFIDDFVVAWLKNPVIDNHTNDNEQDKEKHANHGYDLLAQARMIVRVKHCTPRVQHPKAGGGGGGGCGGGGIHGHDLFRGDR